MSAASSQSQASIANTTTQGLTGDALAMLAAIVVVGLVVWWALKGKL